MIIVLYCLGSFMLLGAFASSEQPDLLVTVFSFSAAIFMFSMASVLRRLNAIRDAIRDSKGDAGASGTTPGAAVGSCQSTKARRESDGKGPLEVNGSNRAGGADGAPRSGPEDEGPGWNRGQDRGGVPHRRQGSCHVRS